MKKSQLSDKQLEEILGQMPKIKDHRDPRDIYQNIAHRVEKRRMPAWVIPSAAMAAVLFLAFILSPGLMDWNQSADKSIDSKSSPESNMAMDMDTATKESSAKNTADQADQNIKMDTSTEDEDKGNEFTAKVAENPYAGLNALYKEELEGQESEVITYAIPDQNGQILVPITTTVPKEEGKPWIDSFTETMPKLKEEEWGLSEFYPVDATFNYNETSKTLNMDVKADHPYKNGSVSSTLLLDAMSQNLSGKGIDKLTFTTEQKPGMDLGNYGMLDEGPITPAANEMRAYMFYQQDDNTQPFLVPTKEQFDTIMLAFEQMQGNIEELQLTASLPKDFSPAKIEPEDDQTELKIILDNKMALDNEFLPNLEAILMTAKEFGYQSVKFENAGTEQIGPFILNDPIPVPVAPNKKVLE
ncbi:MAG: negative regulator of sigma-X activity [Mesobacillus sp.]|uniref:negative regulator of sigma-X activity n=1 Tax=Mesobacillus sp. TaxID=2675271 RepID=UPI003C5B4798